ncbi:hypothetical protein [Desertivirga arenae]|uniref:hypothetical protein n=1 Tax=Desertivirga arenae TaxID=2810309 RepID=UPI001A96BC33|nr:hypothetical protein [Pedobacter sp. SYSU D00823]
MENLANSSLILGSILSLIFSVIAFFVRQLHSDFKKVEQNLFEIKTSTELIKANMHNENRRIFERINFHEKRLEQLELYLLNSFETEALKKVRQRNKSKTDEKKVD